MKKLIRDIEIRRIRPNLRTVYSVDCLEETIRQIRSSGQVEPITVYFEYDSFRILDGEKRYRACKSLGMKTIRAVIAA